MKRAERGFVLLIVLWALALLGLIGTQLAAAARAELSTASAHESAARLQAAADGGINAAIFAILSGRLQADAQPRAATFGAIRLTTTISNEAGRINPNSSPFVLMTAFLRVLGVNSARAEDLATAMLIWRTRADFARPDYLRAGLPYAPSGMPFTSLDEIGLVLGMTPNLLTLMKPHLSLFQQGDVDARFADPIVRRALDTAAAGATPLQALKLQVNDHLYRITVTAAAADHRRFVRSSEVRFTPPAYTILSWTRE